MTRYYMSKVSAAARQVCKELHPDDPEKAEQRARFIISQFRDEQEFRPKEYIPLFPLNPKLRRDMMTVNAVLGAMDNE